MFLVEGPGPGEGGAAAKIVSAALLLYPLPWTLIEPVGEKACRDQEPS